MRLSGRTVSLYLFLTLAAILFLYPFFWMITSSLKSHEELFTAPWELPHVFRWANFTRAWERANLGRAFMSSLLVTGTAVALITAFASIAAYAFSRIEFKGKLLYYPILMALSLPVEALIIPLFVLLNKLGLSDTYLGLILPYTALNTPFAMFILSEFFITIPRSFEESALLDGASYFEIIRDIILPVSWPAISAAAVLSFLFIWNEFTLALIIVSQPDLYTIPLALKVFTGKYFTEYPPLFASLTMASVPIIIIYIILQRQFIRGLTAGAFKG